MTPTSQPEATGVKTHKVAEPSSTTSPRLAGAAPKAKPRWVPKCELPALWGPKGLDRVTVVPKHLEGTCHWKHFDMDEVRDLGAVLDGLRTETKLEVLKSMGQEAVKRYCIAA